MKCPQCHKEMKKKVFDVGYDVEVNSLNCSSCEFNVTDETVLDQAMDRLKEQMTKEIKIIEIGAGLGIRFPNEVVKQLKLKKGEEIKMKPEKDGIKLVIL